MSLVGFVFLVGDDAAAVVRLVVRCCVVVRCSRWLSLSFSIKSRIAVDALCRFLVGTMLAFFAYFGSTRQYNRREDFGCRISNFSCSCSDLVGSNRWVPCGSRLKSWVNRYTSLVWRLISCNTFSQIPKTVSFCCVSSSKRSLILPILDTTLRIMCER